MTQPITISAIHDAYRSGVLTPHKLLHRCLQHAQADENHAWISVLSPEQLDDYLQKLDWSFSRRFTAVRHSFCHQR